MKRFGNILSLSIFSFIISTKAALSVDVDPRDYVAAPPGTNLALSYNGYTTNFGNGDADFDASINIARFVTYVDIGGYTVDPQILIPYGYQSLEAGGAEFDTTGIGDPILAATVWLKSDDKWEWGITPFLTVPVGSYDNNEALNFGGNRWVFSLQNGLVHKLTDKTFIEGIADFTIFGDNDDAGPGSATLEQDLGYQLQGIVSHKITDSTTLGANFSFEHVGSQTIGGVDQNNESEVFDIGLTAQTWVTDSVQIQAKLQQDVHNSGALEETTTFQLRFLKVF